MSWGKTVRNSLVIAAGVLVLLGATVYVTIHTAAFNRFVTEKVIEQAEQATGSPVEIRSMEIHWNELGVDVYGLAIQGREGKPAPPFLQADHVGIGLKIVSVLRKKVDFRSLVLDRPVLDLRVNAQGESNVPKTAPSNSSSSPVKAIFDLAVGHLAVHSGEIRYSDRTVPVSVDLSDFRADAGYGLLDGRYKGSLAYSNGTVLVQDFRPIEHDVRANFTASRSELDLEPLVVGAGETRITAHAKLTNYDNPSVQIAYEGSVSTPQLAQIFKISGLPVAQAAINGTARYQYAATQTFLNSLSVDGQLASPRVGIRLGRQSTDAQAVKASFSLEKGNLHVPALTGDLLQGRVRAKGDMLDLAGQISTRVSANLDGISLEAVNQLLPPGSYRRLRVTGNANIDAQASWPSRIEDIAGHARISISAPQKPPRAGTIPLNGLIDVRYDGPRNTADFGQSHLQTGNTRISLAGKMSRRSNLTVQANTTDLREVSALISEISAATSSAQGAPPAALDLQGQAQFAGQVSGAPQDPRIEGQLTAMNVEVEGSRWQSMHTSVQLSSSRIALQNAALQSAGRGELRFTAAAGLDDWSLTATSPITLQANASDMSVAALEHLAKEHYPVDGTLAANVTLQGTREKPSGHGSIQITNASAWDQPVNSLSANFNAARNSIESSAQVRLPGGNIEANASFDPATKQYSGTVNTSGLKLDRLQAVQVRNLGIAGLFSAEVRGQGSVDNPELSANMQVSDFRFRDQAMSSAQASMNLMGKRVDFTLRSTIAQGNVDAKGNVELAGDYNTDATLDVRSVPVGAVLASYISGVPPNLQGQAEIHASVSGPLKNPALIQAHVEIPVFNLAYQSANIALARPLRLDYRQGIATLQPTELKGTGTDLTVQGEMPLKSKSTGFSVTANGGMDLSVLQGFVRGIKSSGRIDLHLTGQGDFANPAMQGQVKIENAYFSSDLSPLGIEGVNGQVNLSGRRLEIAQLKGTAGGGTVAMQGFMSVGSPSNFNVTLQSDSVRLRYPEGLRSVLNCNLQLAGSTAASNLTGRVIVDRLSFTQQFDLSNFADQFSSETSAESSSPLEQNMKLNVAVQTSQNLNLASSQISMQGAANLNLTGTLANPVVLGRMNLNGGEIFFMSKRFEVQNGGTIEFANPVRTEPVVNLYVQTRVQQYTIKLNFVGPVDRLRTTYTSEPALPTSDIISLLTSGQTGEESALNNTPASTSAESVVASGVAGQFSGRLEKLVGITQLTIDPLAAENNSANPASQVSIQQRVSGNILLTFSTDVTSTQATSVQVQYRTSKATSVSVLRDQNGGYAVDLRVHKTF